MNLGRVLRPGSITYPLWFEMVFSSNIFLFLFLPIVVLIHTLLPKALRNTFIFVASLFFYIWGSGPVVFLLLVSIVFNYFCAKYIYRHVNYAKTIFVTAIAFNLILLFYFKYSNFFWIELARALQFFSFQLAPHEKILLPIGISFFTFQAISYLGEVYRNEQTPADNVIDYGMYIALFPHLIAGPIVRFSDISREIRARDLSLNDMFEGVWRFTLGLSKKIILANRLGEVADRIFSLPSNELTSGLAWLATICYTFQIYYDFSGYSDMAIGLARMMGFRFPENFDQPYRSKSITEFWRRWHMTLSRWFRDFVYIPLGGNRRGSATTYLNLWIVFFLCGLWHGAAWTFVVWGLYHGLLLVIERVMKQQFHMEPHGFLGNMVTMLLVAVGWVLFRSESFDQASAFLKAMFGMSSHSGFQHFGAAFYLERDVILCLVLSVFFSWLPVERCQFVGRFPVIQVVSRMATVLVLVVYCAAILSTSGFNPFIYFRF